MKLFNLGLPKSGTSTLHEALKRSGLTAAHWYVGHKRRYVGRSLYREFLSGRDPLGEFAEYDAITQADFVNDRGSFWPQMDVSMLRTIREYHSDCIFLLLRRHPDKVLSSIERWTDFRDRLTKLGAPGLPAGSAKYDQMVLAWIENHYDNMQVLFGSDPRFIALDIEDPCAREKLERALNVPIAWWGRANVNTVRPDDETVAA